jgi:hypothetical protein
MFLTPENPYFPIKWLLDDDGKLIKRPPKQNKQLIALAYIAEKIPADISFTEKEFNELLNNRHHFNDAALLRRELYMKEYIDRELDGSKYWKQYIEE